MFYDKYKNLCDRNGISPSAAAVEIGLNKSNVSAWKNNGYSPRASTIQKIAEYFNVPTSYFLEDSAGMQHPEPEKVSAPDLSASDLIARLQDLLPDTSLSSDEQRILDIYRSAPDQGKAFLRNAADMVESAYLGKNNQSESVEAAS